MTFENLIFEKNETIATITFNRPKALNALNQDLLKELNQLIDTLENDPDIKVVILTGAGEKAFVAGADITQLAAMTPLQGKQFSTMGQKTFARLEALPMPVIAAVNGFALGGGTEIAISCDFIYASEKASFGLPEINLGIIPGFGGTQRLARLIGVNKAKELVFTGKIIPASEAEKMGIVNKICPHDTLMDDVMKTAQAIASKGKVSLRAAKDSINTGLNVDLETGCRLECDAFALCMTSPDAKEGTGAFLEKRKAVFTGKLNL